MQQDDNVEAGAPVTRGASKFGPDFASFEDVTTLALWFDGHEQQALSDCGWPRDAGDNRAGRWADAFPGAWNPFQGPHDDATAHECGPLCTVHGDPRDTSVAPIIPPYPETLEAHARSVEAARQEGK